PGFASRRQAHSELRKAPHGRECDLVFRAGIFRRERALKPGSGDAAGWNTPLVGESGDTLDQALASFAQARTTSHTILDHYSVGTIALQKSGHLSKGPLHRLGGRLGGAHTPVKQTLRSVEDREAEAARDGIDGEDTFHRS